MFIDIVKNITIAEMFPNGIPEIIADYAAIYELTARAKKYENEFDIHSLSANPRACEYIFNKASRSHRPWEITNKIDWTNISKNPSASEIYHECSYYVEIEVIGNLNFQWVKDLLVKTEHEEKGLNKDVMFEISKNPEYIIIIIRNINNVDNINLCENHAAIDILTREPDRIEWRIFSRQPWAIKFIEQNLDKVNWKSLSANIAALHILEKNPEKIDWQFANMFGNIPLLSTHPEKIKWGMLSQCTDNASLVGPFLRNHLDKVNWRRLSFNPMHIDILRENPEHIVWDNLLENMGGGGDLLLTLPDDEIEWSIMAYNEEIFEARRSEEVLVAIYAL